MAKAAARRHLHEEPCDEAVADGIQGVEALAGVEVDDEIEEQEPGGDVLGARADDEVGGHGLVRVKAGVDEQKRKGSRPEADANADVDERNYASEKKAEERRENSACDRCDKEELREPAGSAFVFKCCAGEPEKQERKEQVEEAAGNEGPGDELPDVLEGERRLKCEKAGDRGSQARSDDACDQEEEEAGDCEQDDLSRETAKGWQREKSRTA